MRQGAAGRRDAHSSGHSPSHALLNGAAAPPVFGRDPQLGQIFRNMRVAMRLQREALARRLATTPTTIDDFEAGALTLLPNWKETVRIVRAYCEPLRLDPEPILWRLQGQLRALQGAPATPPPPPAVQPQGEHITTRPPPASLTRAEARTARQPRRRARMFALSAPFALLAGVAILTQVAPAPIYRAIAWLPAPLENAARSGADYLLLLSAPRREGLTWIDIGDPRLRKADKLTTSAP